MSDKDPKIVIIGGGMSGVAMGVQLLLQNRKNFVIFEKSNHVGGTWYGKRILFTQDSFISK